MAYYQGKNIIVSVGAKAVAASTSCNLKIGSDTVEVASPETGTFKAYRATRLSWEVTVNTFVTNIYTAANMVGKTVSISIGELDRRAYDLIGQENVRGTAICTAWNVTATRGNLAQGSFKFKGTGEFKINDDGIQAGTIG